MPNTIGMDDFLPMDSTLAGLAHGFVERQLSIGFVVMVDAGPISFAVPFERFAVRFDNEVAAIEQWMIVDSMMIIVVEAVVGVVPVAVVAVAVAGVDVGIAAVTVAAVDIVAVAAVIVVGVVIVVLEVHFHTDKMV